MSNKIEIETTNTMVVKHRDIVHNTVYSEKLTPNAMNYLYMLIAQVHKDDTSFEWYSTTRAELEKLLGVDVKTKMLQNIMRSLMNLQLERHNIKEGSIKAINVFSMAEIKPKDDENILSFKFNSDMKPYLLGVTKAGGYLGCSLEYAMNLTSFHSKVLYEICKDKLERYASKETSYLFELDVEYIKLVMSVPKYQYGDIKNRILKKAQEDFLKHTDISIEFNENKKGRKVVSLDIEVTRTKAKPTKKENNFKPYLKFRDWLLEHIPLNEDYCEEIDDGIWLFDLGNGFMARIDEYKNEIHSADENGAFIDSTYQEDMDEVDEGWQRVFEDENRIKGEILNVK